MALPASGIISIGDIRTELSNTGTAPFALSKAGSQNGATRGDGYTPINQNSSSKPNSSSPFAVSEWYSYNHGQNGGCGSVYSASIGSPYLYHRVNITGTTSTWALIFVTISGDGSGHSYITRIYDSYPFSNTGVPSTSAPAPLTTITITGNNEQNFWYQLPSSSAVLYFVSWNNSII